MRQLIFCILISAHLSAVAAPTSLVIKFNSFEGKNCGYIPGSEMLFIDRWSPATGASDIPWEKLSGRDLSRRRIDIPLSDVPTDTRTWEIYFRMYAAHSSSSADQYESDLRLTQNFIATLHEGQVTNLSLTMNPVYQSEKGRQCRLNLQFVLL